MRACIICRNSAGTRVRGSLEPVWRHYVVHTHLGQYPNKKRGPSITCPVRASITYLHALSS